MRALISSMFVLAAAALLVCGMQADAGEKKGEGKEVTIKGTITCAKCDLKQEKACTTVIVAKEGDKETVYYFDPAAGKKYHAKICTEPMPGSVVGTVKTEGEKKVVTVKKVEFK